MGLEVMDSHNRWSSWIPDGGLGQERCEVDLEAHAAPYRGCRGEEGLGLCSLTTRAFLGT